MTPGGMHAIASRCEVGSDEVLCLAVNDRMYMLQAAGSRSTGVPEQS